MEPLVRRWLSTFALDPLLCEQVAQVIEALPPAVRDDLMGDPSFKLCDYQPAPGAMMMVPVGVPAVGGHSRSVVLKRTLRDRPAGFTRYVIAHELAHAHLRNAGRHEGDDPEHAADALAAEWGFPRPTKW